MKPWHNLKVIQKFMDASEKAGASTCACSMSQHDYESILCELATFARLAGWAEPREEVRLFGFRLHPDSTLADGQFVFE